MKQDFKDVKVGDKLLVERSHYSERSFWNGTVTKVTGTRFTVTASCFGENGQVFTKDGDIYPRATGYGRVYTQIKVMDDEAKSLVLKHKLSVKARSLANRLNELFASANVRRRMTDLELDPKEIEESIEMLETTIKRFEKYSKEST